MLDYYYVISEFGSLVTWSNGVILQIMGSIKFDTDLRVNVNDRVRMIYQKCQFCVSGLDACSYKGNTKKIKEIQKLTERRIADSKYV